MNKKRKNMRTNKKTNVVNYDQIDLYAKFNCVAGDICDTFNRLQFDIGINKNISEDFIKDLFKVINKHRKKHLKTSMTKKGLLYENNSNNV